MTAQSTADVRGERLYPWRRHSRYYMLTTLRQEIDKIIDTCLPPGNGLLALDYGCGNMPYRPLFDQAGVEYMGADYSDNEMASVVVSLSGDVERRDQSCDIVVSTQVLEHVQDPKRYLAECYRLLRPGGRLVLSTHGYWLYHPDPTDFWRWTKDGLRLITEEAGFRIVRFTGLIGLAAVAVQLFQDATICRLPRFIRSYYSYFMQQAMRFADSWHTEHERARDSLVFVLVAERPDT